VPKLSETHKAFVILAVGALVAIGGGVGAYVWSGKVKEVEEKIAAAQTKYDANEKEIAKIDGLKKEVVAYHTIVRQNSQILPTDAELTTFLRWISNLDKETGVTLKSVPNYVLQSNVKGGVQGITRIPMTMQVSGSTRAFLRFLNELEKYERLVSVVDFRFSPGDEKDAQGGEVEHDVAVKFEIYRYDAKTQGVDLDKIIRQGEFDDLRNNDPTVKKILQEKGRPVRIERYQLLPGRDARRDPFIDPRRRIGPSSANANESDPSKQDEAILEVLGVQLEKAQSYFESFKLADQRSDYLLQAANRRLFEQARAELEENLRRVAAKPLTSRQHQDRYSNEIDRPYRALAEQANRLFSVGPSGPEGGTGPRLTVAIAADTLRRMRDHAQAREWEKCLEQSLNLEQLVKDAKDRIDEGARAPLAELRLLAERAQAQTVLAKKGFKVQGIVKMPHSSAIIVNDKTYFQGKKLDAETIFLRVTDEGAILFTVGGKEADYVPEKPKLIPMDKASLGQE
jgi:Tfp pilus assembly protein PilO